MMNNDEHLNQFYLFVEATVFKAFDFLNIIFKSKQR